MLPKRRKGRPTEATNAKYDRELKEFSWTIREMVSTLGFSVTIRGLCYLLEQNHGLLKSEFEDATTVINLCRKRGYLPRNFVIEEGRNIDGIFRSDDYTPEEFVSRQLERLKYVHEYYDPIGLWDNQMYCPILVVEKADLKSMWRDQCNDYQLPVVNSRGWSSITLRQDIAEIFAEAESNGKRPIILHAGDHDATGIAISDLYMEHFEELELSTGWNPKNLVINRFALNYDTIEQLDLGWIIYEPKKTKKSDTEDDDDSAPFRATKKMERDYLAKYGPRKCESNALVTRPDLAKRMLDDAVNSILDHNLLQEYQDSLQASRSSAYAIMDSRVNFSGELLY